MTQQNYAPDAYEEQRTGWVGWIVFAGTMMIIGGTLNAFYGLVAVLNDDWVVWQNRSAVFLDLSGWGWVHLILGLVVVLCGFGVMTGNILARTVGVIVAGISMIANFFAIPVYPVWSLTIIAIDMLVIWALTAHGREMRV
jgi:hypothetical protein